MTNNENSGTVKMTSENTGNKDVSVGFEGSDLRRNIIFEENFLDEIKKIFQDNDTAGTVGGWQKNIITTITG